MKQLYQLIPDAATVIDMHTAELAGYVLESLMSAGEMERGVWNRRNFCMQVSRGYSDVNQNPNTKVGIACSTAWAWLESNGLICQHPDQDIGWFLSTKRAGEIGSREALHRVISNQQLPEEFLHPELLVNARPLFLQSRFETAVFEAFKSLEVAIRNAAKLGHEMIGVQLAGRAFHPEDGALTDKAAEKGERVALMNLMTGALGSYKNPSSHRRVEISVEEARDMLILASHLLKIVDERAI
ncbi:MAG: TIGR02391 family protein [Burkholderiaceae bacterium]